MNVSYVKRAQLRASHCRNYPSTMVIKRHFGMETQHAQNQNSSVGVVPLIYMPKIPSVGVVPHLLYWC